MSSKPLAVLKSVGPKLVPFFKTAAIYFVLYGQEARLATVTYCLFKCLPVISLILFVLLHGMNFSDAYAYSRRILIGLIFSCIGDAFLVWKNYGYFLHGVGMFAIAQMCYASAFGMRPFNVYAGSVCGIVMAMVYNFLWPGLHGVMTVIVFAYLFLILFMAWRAIARVQLFDDLWTWTKLCSCFGSILFLVSDLIIATEKFVFSVPYGHTLIMLTYYAAQLGISLSVVDSQVDVVHQVPSRLILD